jgi:hypothetical protein
MASCDWKRCPECGRLFRPGKHACRQIICGRRECYRKRKRRWQRNHLKKDPEYRIKQAAAHRRWVKANRNYWREYHRRKRQETGSSQASGRRRPCSSIFRPCFFLRWLILLFLLTALVARTAPQAEDKMGERDACRQAFEACLLSNPRPCPPCLRQGTATSHLRSQRASVPRTVGGTRDKMDEPDP